MHLILQTSPHKANFYSLPPLSLSILLIIFIICFSLSDQQLSSSPPISPSLPSNLSLKHSSAADLNRGRVVFKRRADWLTGCLASSGDWLSVLWDEVKGHGPESPGQKADHNRGLIIMHCCWAPAGTPPSLSPPSHTENLGTYNI